MQREGIEELFDYVNWAWDRIVRVVDGLPAGSFERAVEGSGWPSIAQCMTHWVSAYDGWINMEFGLNRGEPRYPANWPDPVTNWEAMKAYRAGVVEDVQALLREPDSYLFGKKEYRLTDAPELISPADVLTNMVLHERGHHGDLNTLFHQLGVQSYLIDYRFFRSRPGDFVMDVD